MTIRTESEYRAAIARKNEINRELDRTGFCVFDDNSDNELDLELMDLCSRIELYEDRCFYSSVASL